MKKSNILCLSLLVAACGLSHATTVNFSLNPGAAVFYGEDGNIMTSADSTVQVGTFSVWDFGSAVTDLGTMGFSEFAASGNTYDLFSTLGILSGTGSLNDVSGNAFDGDQVYVVVTDTDTGSFGVFSGTNGSNWTFPANLGGAGDTLSVFNLVSDIDQVAGAQSFASGFQVVPEPSTYAALSGLLALGYVMVRRRRA
jgi:hypothetical protein